MAIIGTVSLLGVIVNDSIVMLEFLRSYVKEDGDFIASVAKGAAVCLHFIMMTTITTVVGVMPVALGFSGHEFYLQPLAVTIVFGILFLSIITLFLVPVLIMILEEDCGHIFKKSQHVRNLLFNTYVWRKFKMKIQKILSPIFSFILLFLIGMPAFAQDSPIPSDQSVISEMDF
ncbi:efflux RND transporter permease subunit [Brevinema andersonii]|nr:efflux RND transporter permease subunit [Brevinema andersonii]